MLCVICSSTRTLSVPDIPQSAIDEEIQIARESNLDTKPSALTSAAEASKRGPKRLIISSDIIDPPKNTQDSSL